MRIAGSRDRTIALRHNPPSLRTTGHHQGQRFFCHVMSALAEMERELIIERTRAGLADARAKGRIGGLSE